MAENVGKEGEMIGEGGELCGVSVGRSMGGGGSDIKL